MKEQDLFQALRNKERADDGFRELMKQYNQQLYGFIRNICLDHHDTDEVLQMTYIKVYKYIDGFKGKSSLRTWIYQIARNEAITYLKNKARRKHQAIEKVILEHAEQLRADLYYDASDIEHRLLTAVAKLPLKQREVFNMRYYQHMTYQEMAEITQLSIGGLKANYHHAVNKLKQSLELIDLTKKK